MFCGIATTFLTALMACLSCVARQQREIDENTPELADRLLGIPEEDDPVAVESSAQFFTSLFNLNEITREELEALHLVDQRSIESLLSYREQYGPFLDVLELQAVPGLDLETAQLISRHVTVIHTFTVRTIMNRILSPGNGYVVMRYQRTLEKKRGLLSASGFAGSADQVYFRMRTSLPGDYSIGFTGEKDEGERMQFSPKTGQWGFDFTSFHLQLRNKGRIKNLIAGDYQFQFAQGLVFGGALSTGKSGEEITVIRRSSTGFHPYTSVNESGFMRGVAFSVELSPVIIVSAFHSRTFRDASPTGTDSLESFSIQRSGLHRTLTEISNRRQLLENNSGLIASYQRRNFDGGILINRIFFDPPVMKRPALFNAYSFAGTENINSGAYFNYRRGNAVFFGEVARSIGAGSGLLVGMLATPDKNLDIGMLVRRYSRDFHTFYSNAFSENSEPRNESGVYWAWKYRFGRRYTLSGYVDLFQFPWLGFRRYSPSNGYEWNLRADYRPVRHAGITAQFREEFKAANLPFDETLYRTGYRTRRAALIKFSYGTGQNFQLTSRLQHNMQTFAGAITKGWAIVQDFGYRWNRLKLSARHALFETDHYDNRHYVFEADTWSAYSFPALAGIGVRNYLLLEYKPGRSVTLWLRFSSTRLVNAQQIGTGVDSIEGNTRQDAKFQARWTF